MRARFPGLCRFRALRRWLPLLSAAGLSSLLTAGAAQAADEPAAPNLLPANVPAEVSRALQQLPPSASLLDAWLALENHDGINWVYSFVVPRHAMYKPSAVRLDAELASVAMQARVSGRSALVEALHAWRDAIAALPHGRVPGRHDPVWLMQHLRHVPQVGSLAALGWCQRPAWVEAWSTAGVTRVDWQSGMTTQGLLEALPNRARQSADRAHVVTPLGEIQPLGIAPWNYQRVALAPGSRMIVGLPMDTTEVEWLDTALPRFLSTRVPGEACVMLPLSANAADNHAD